MVFGILRWSASDNANHSCSPSTSRLAIARARGRWFRSLRKIRLTMSLWNSLRLLRWSESLAIEMVRNLRERPALVSERFDETGHWFVVRHLFVSRHRPNQFVVTRKTTRPM